MKDYLISVLVWAFFLITLILLFPFFSLYWLIIRRIDPSSTALHYLTARWSQLYLFINPFWKYRIFGKEKLVRNRPVIIISNHQSLLDTLIIYQLRFTFKFVSKAELFKVPFLGWMMRMNDYIEILRGDKLSSEKMMLRCKKELQQGCSVMMFPEGTRSSDGTLRSFKEGAFRMALENKTDLQAIIIDGTSQALPKKGIIMHKNRAMVLKVLDPIPYGSFKERSVPELTKEVREIMENELTLLRAPHKTK